MTLDIDPPKTIRFLRELRALLDELADHEVGWTLLLALLAVLFLGLLWTLVPSSFATFLDIPVGAVQAALLVLGVACAATAIWLHRRRPDLRDPKAPPIDAIKGAAAWTSSAADHELFLEVGRNDEIARLQTWVQDNHAGPALRLVAPEGTGKTSLLRAGLIPKVKESGYHAVYWSATSENAVPGILRMIRETWHPDSPPPSRLEDLRLRLRAQSLLIVVDDAENLPEAEAEEILAEVRALVAAGPPHRQRWLFAFNENRTQPDHLNPDDLDFESEHLTGLDLEGARLAVRTIAEKAGMAERAQAITAALESWTYHGAINPSDLSLLLQMSYTLPVETSRLLLPSGGPLELTRRYLSHHLGSLHPEDPEIARRLLAQLTEKPEGVHGEELASELGIPPAQVKRIFRTLGSRKINIVRATTNGYVLGHPRFLQAAKNLDPESLTRYQAEHLQRRVHLWQDEGRPKSLLLRGSELERLDGSAIDADVLTFIRASKRWNRLRGVRAFGAAAAVCCLVAAVWYWSIQRGKTQLMLGWDLPTDLPAVQDQLLSLTLAGNVHRLNWLHADLETLDLSSTRVSDLGRVPRTVTTLVLNSLDPREPLRPRLPRTVTRLDLRHAPLRIAENPLLPGIEHLALGGATEDLLSLPSGLRSLTLELSGYTVISDLPSDLRHLDIVDKDLARIDRLPEELELLSLRSTALAELPPLPHSIRHLRLLRNWQLRLPDSPLPALETVALEAPLLQPAPPGTLRHLVDFVRTLPADLQCLSLGNFHVDPSILPPHLTALALYDPPTEALGALPQTLQALSIRAYDGPLDWVPPGLLHLDISFSRRTEIPPLPANLQELDISTTEIVRWNSAVPPNLRRLAYRNSSAKRLLPLPETLRELDLARVSGLSELTDLPPQLEWLDVSGSEVERIEWPPNLRVLDVANSRVTELTGLPDSLQSLTLHVGQVDRIGDLPVALTELRFVGAERSRDHAAGAASAGSSTERTVCDRELDLWP